MVSPGEVGADPSSACECVVCVVSEFVCECLFVSVLDGGERAPCICVSVCVCLHVHQHSGGNRSKSFAKFPLSNGTNRK